MPLATRVYRELGDAGMVMAMQKLEGVDDAALLAGHVALVCGYHDLAQELFLASSHPISALEMRRDLLDWEVALKLAQTLAPDQVPSISREFQPEALDLFPELAGDALLPKTGVIVRLVLVGRWSLLRLRGPALLHAAPPIAENALSF